jgi:rod shape-determining protein MreD
MQWFRFVVLVLAAAVTQTGFAGLLSAVHSGFRLDLLLILLVFFATHCENREAVIASFAIGLAADMANPAAGAEFLGPKIISYGLLGTLLSDLNGVLSIRRFSHRAIAIFVMGVFVCLLTYLLARIKTGAAGAELDRELFWQPLLSGIIGPILFSPTAWWMKMNRKRRPNVR